MCEAKTRTQWHDYSVYCLLYVLLVTHLRSDARQVCVHLLSTLQQCPLFVESECDALSVYVRELLLTCLSRRSAS